MLLLPFLLCLLAGHLCSCGLWGGQKSGEEGLLAAADHFNTDVRWEDYKAASACIAPSGKEEFWNQVERLQGRVRIMDYQVVDVGLKDDGESGTVTLRYRFFHKNNPQIQTKTLRQQWLFSKKDRTWQVVEYDLQKLMAE
jgi:hypothetical protein